MHLPEQNGAPRSPIPSAKHRPAARNAHAHPQDHPGTYNISTSSAPHVADALSSNRNIALQMSWGDVQSNNNQYKGQKKSLSQPALPHAMERWRHEKYDGGTTIERIWENRSSYTWKRATERNARREANKERDIDLAHIGGWIPKQQSSYELERVKDYYPQAL